MSKEKNIEVKVSRWLPKVRYDGTSSCNLSLLNSTVNDSDVKWEVAQNTNKHLNVAIVDSTLAVTPSKDAGSNQTITVYAKVNNKVVAKREIEVKIKKNKKLVLWLCLGLCLFLPVALVAVGTPLLVNEYGAVTISDNMPKTLEMGKVPPGVDLKVGRGTTEIQPREVNFSYSPDEIISATYDEEVKQIFVVPVKPGQVTITVEVTLDDGSVVEQPYDIYVLSAYPEYVTVTPSKQDVYINESQSDEIVYKAIVGPEEQVVQEVKWFMSFDGSSENPLPDGFTFTTTSNTARLAINKPLPDEHEIVVYAKTIQISKEGVPLVSDEVTNKIKISNFYPDSVSISGDWDPMDIIEGEPESRQFTSEVYPEGVSQDVTWVAEYNGSEELPTGISLDPETGEFIVDDTAIEGTYNITIHAEANQTDREGNVVKSESKTIPITITKPISRSISVDATVPSTINVASGTTYEEEFTATVNPEHAVQTVTWEAVDRTTGLAISGIEFDGNKIKIGSTLNNGIYNVKVRATTTDHVAPDPQISSEWQNLTITVVDLAIAGKDNIAYLDKNTTSLKERQFTNAYDPSSFTGEILWHVVDSTTGNPVNGIYFENSGKDPYLSIDATKITFSTESITYLVNVYATGKLSADNRVVTSNIIQFPITVIDPTKNGVYIQGDTTTIYQKYYSIGTSRTYTATVTPYGTVPSSVNWTLNSANSLGALPSGITYTVKDDGIHCDLKVAGSVGQGKYPVDISCSATLSSGKVVYSQHLVVTIEVLPQPHNQNKLVYNGTTYTLYDNFDPNQLCWENKAAQSTHAPLSVTYYPNPETSTATDTLTIPWTDRNKITKVLLRTCKPTITSVNDRFLYAMYKLNEVDISGLCNVTTLGLTFIGGIARKDGQDFDAGFTLLKKVDLSPLSNVLTIAGDFMYNCTGLESIDISPLYNIPDLGSYFLQRCIKITEVNFSNMVNINKIDRRFMHCCTNLLRVDLSQAKKLLASNAIKPGFVQDCPNLTEVNLGTIKSAVFANDRSLATTDNPDFNFALWTQFTTDPTSTVAYKNGITIKGTDAATIVSRFTNSTGKTVGDYKWYRKIKT